MTGITGQIAELADKVRQLTRESNERIRASILCKRQIALLLEQATETVPLCGALGVNSRREAVTLARRYTLLLKELTEAQIAEIATHFDKKGLELTSAACYAASRNAMLRGLHA
jgi:hypothetical protein